MRAGGAQVCDTMSARDIRGGVLESPGCSRSLIVIMSIHASSPQRNVAISNNCFSRLSFPSKRSCPKWHDRWGVDFCRKSVKPRDRISPSKEYISECSIPPPISSTIVSACTNWRWCLFQIIRKQFVMK